MGFVRGIEMPIAPVRRSGSAIRPLMLQLSSAEAMFLLCRVANISRASEAILHHPAAHEHRSAWSRSQVVERVTTMNRYLRQNPNRIFLITRLDREIIVDAVEHSPYFAEMDDRDPRLTVDAVRQADALRVRLSHLLRQPIAKVPLGTGRSWLKSPTS
jgi:hypothetical protein